MADGMARRELRTPPVGKAPTGLESTDADKLRALRAGIMVTLEAQVNIANRIHDPALRDAALVNLVKRHARTVQASPARMSQLRYEIDTLLHIADMMSDEAKRLGMLAYVKKLSGAK